jgi:transcriptional regulator with XRE-family HTH domain
MLTPTRCQAARGQLQWTRERLAREAGRDVAAVTAFELDQGPADAGTIAALTGALEAAGIGFACANDDGLVMRERRNFG